MIWYDMIVHQAKMLDYLFQVLSVAAWCLKFNSTFLHCVTVYQKSNNLSWMKQFDGSELSILETDVYIWCERPSLVP